MECKMDGHLDDTFPYYSRLPQELRIQIVQEFHDTNFSLLITPCGECQCIIIEWGVAADKVKSLPRSGYACINTEWQQVFELHIWGRSLGIRHHETELFAKYCTGRRAHILKGIHLIVGLHQTECDTCHNDPTSAGLNDPECFTHNGLMTRLVENAFAGIFQVLCQWPVERPGSHLLELSWEICGYPGAAQWPEECANRPRDNCKNFVPLNLACDFSRLPEIPIIGSLDGTTDREFHDDCWVHRGCRGHTDRLHPDSHAVLVSRCPQAQSIHLELGIEEELEEPIISNTLEGMFTLIIVFVSQLVVLPRY